MQLSQLQQGVKPSRIYLPHDKIFIGGTVLDFLCAHFAHISVEVWQQRLQRGLVTTHDGERLDIDSPYQAGQTLFYYRDVGEETAIPFTENILYVDEHLIVVDKPHFLPVIPTGKFVKETLLTRLRLRPELQHLDVMAISPIHRLDKDTAGVMLFSHNPATRGAYQSLFEQKAVQKTYEAIAPTRTDLAYPYQIASRLVRGEAFFLTQTVAGELNSFTTIELVETLGNYHGVNYSRYRLIPLTGKKHQLRVHMASLDMPLMHDNFYPSPQPQGTTDFTKPLKLLAKSIAFKDPISGINQIFESQLALNITN